jgi:tRNA A37 N6-isopentenylltransferase MiaA
LDDDVVYLPAVEYLQGKISVEEARARVVANLVRRARDQMEAYHDFDIRWIVADDTATARIVAIVDQILKAEPAGRRHEPK